jgi:hypothetical protein
MVILVWPGSDEWFSVARYPILSHLESLGALTTPLKVTMPAYYLNLFTGQTWDEFNANGAGVSGFRESRWKTVKRMKPGDLLVGYLTGVSRFIGLLEVTSGGFRADDPIWSRETFPVRVGVRPLITLTPETAVPVKALKDRLSWFEEGAHPLAWTGRVRGSPTKLQPSDAEAIIQAMKGAEANPVHRAVDPKVLARAPRVYSIGEGDGEVTIPEAEDDSGREQLEVMPAEGPTAAPKEEQPAVVTHEEIQYMLLKLGASIGLDVWVARNDKSKRYSGQRFGDMPKVKDSLPRQFDEVTNRTIELIDVLWLDGERFVAAFEIEHTTAVYSGLLRMSDLVSMQPNLNIPLYLVAPDERREKVFEEINRPTFSRMRTPLNSICQYLPYSELRQLVDRLGDYVSVLKPDFLERIAEVCDPSALGLSSHMHARRREPGKAHVYNSRSCGGAHLPVVIPSIVA